MSEGKRWRWSGENWLFDDHDDLVLWYTTQDDGLHGYQEDKSIIAAAPDMLEALYQCLGSLKALGAEAGYASEAARAAISKAKGINPDE